MKPNSNVTSIMKGFSWSHLFFLSEIRLHFMKRFFYNFFERVYFCNFLWPVLLTCIFQSVLLTSFFYIFFDQLFLTCSFWQVFSISFLTSCFKRVFFDKFFPSNLYKKCFSNSFLLTFSLSFLTVNLETLDTFQSCSNSVSFRIEVASILFHKGPSLGED